MNKIAAKCTHVIPSPRDLASMRPAALLSALWLIWITIAKASEPGSVSFLESTPGFYLRLASSNTLQGATFSSSDVSAAVSVLLGLAPPSSMNDESAAKLNELLVPNPFHRPRAVLLLSLRQDKPGRFQAIQSEQRDGGGVIVAQQRQLQGEATASPLLIAEDMPLIILNTTDDVLLKSTIVDRELDELAIFLGGSYQGTKKPSKGILSFLLLNDDVVAFDLEKEVHRDLVIKLSSLCHHVQDVASAIDRKFKGLLVADLSLPKELYEAPDSSLTVKEASSFLHLVVMKVFSHLDKVLNGGLVGVVADSENEILALKIKSGPSRLELLESSSSLTTSTVSEVLTETIIAYITGILLIVALIIGICFLSKMPLTRDTLLYSGVKLD